MNEMELEIKDTKNNLIKNKYKFIPIKDRSTSRFLIKYERSI